MNVNDIEMIMIRGAMEHAQYEGQTTIGIDVLEKVSAIAQPLYDALQAEGLLTPEVGDVDVVRNGAVSITPDDVHVLDNMITNSFEFVYEDRSNLMMMLAVKLRERTGCSLVEARDLVDVMYGE